MGETMKKEIELLVLEKLNADLREKSPKEIVDWAISIAETPVITTNFRPFEAAILHAVTQVAPKIAVIWCDTGYNTRNTYRHAERTIEQLNLNVDLFIPQKTAAHRDAVLGIPEVDTPQHSEFTRQVKLEPFARAMKKHQPDVWFTNLRQDQTAFRSNLDILSQSADGVLKVCPFFYWTDEEIQQYIDLNGLETEDNYYDPTKVLLNRECGLHT
jgi:phosphoadenosine phosphosulfate reductase